MLQKVEFSGVSVAEDADAKDYKFRVLSWPQGQRLKTFSFRVQGVDALASKLGSEDIQRAILALATIEITLMGRALLDASGDLTIYPLEISDTKIQEVLHSQKSCRYQQEREQELFCLAVERTAHNADHDPRSACTTLTACNSCPLPDTRVLCSNMRHIEVINGYIEQPRMVVGPRLCELGDERVQDESKCVPGGHDCWQYRIEIGPETTPPILQPLALNEAIDFLSWVWKARFPLAALLLNIRSSSVAAEISQPVQNSKEFLACINALVDLIDKLKVDGNLFSTPSNQSTKPLKRMQVALSDQLPVNDFNRAESAIATLQHVKDLRNSLIHAAQGKNVANAAAKLAIEWPVVAWTSCWARVKAQSTDAFRELRLALEPSVQ